MCSDPPLPLNPTTRPQILLHRLALDFSFFECSVNASILVLRGLGRAELELEKTTSPHPVAGCVREEKLIEPEMLEHCLKESQRMWTCVVSIHQIRHVERSAPRIAVHFTS
jgi:hypothetical protein